MKKISTVAVITDNQFFRDAAAYFLTQQHYAVLDLGRDEHEIHAQLLHQRPDLVILHTAEASAQGANALRCIHEHNLPTKTVSYAPVTSAFPGPPPAYLTRADGLEALLRCVAVLEGGHSPIAPPTAPPAAPVPDPLAVLTPQEIKVLALIGRGLGSSQLASQLFVSPHTIKNHKTNITRKLALAHGRNLLTVALALRNHPALVQRLNPVNQ